MSPPQRSNFDREPKSHRGKPHCGELIARHEGGLNELAVAGEQSQRGAGHLSEVVPEPHTEPAACRRRPRGSGGSNLAIRVRAVDPSRNRRELTSNDESEVRIKTEGSDETEEELSVEHSASVESTVPKGAEFQADRSPEEPFPAEKKFRTHRADRARWKRLEPDCACSSLEDQRPGLSACPTACPRWLIAQGA